MIEVPDHVYDFYAYRLYFADKNIYMIRYFYYKIEIIRLFFSYIHAVYHNARFKNVKYVNQVY